MATFKAKIAVIDDDEALRADLVRFLERQSYQVEQGACCADAVDFSKKDDIDLMILDRIMPDGDSLNVARKILVATDVPIIILSGIDETVERVSGLEAGADDYVTKPVDPTELLARIRSQLRRTERYRAASPDPANPMVLADGTRLDGIQDRLIGPSDITADLTQIETILFNKLIEATAQSLSREELYSSVLGRKWDSSDRSIDVHISHLRQKLRSVGSTVLIKSVRGQGYKMVVDAPTR